MTEYVRPVRELDPSPLRESMTTVRLRILVLVVMALAVAILRLSLIHI